MITDMIAKKIIEQLGLSKETVDKIQQLVDNVNVQTIDEKTFIEIHLKKITLVIEK